ncbi:UNVERIFIED_CONTAM: hypothetical protein K2H54_045795 [Gekko kuhli]
MQQPNRSVTTLMPGAHKVEFLLTRLHSCKGGIASMEAETLWKLTKSCVLTALVKDQKPESCCHGNIYFGEKKQSQFAYSSCLLLISVSFWMSKWERERQLGF